MAISKIIYLLKIIGSLVLTFTFSSFTFSQGEQAELTSKSRVQQTRSIDQMLDQAELSINTNMVEMEKLLTVISNMAKPLDQLQRHRLMLLQANQLILETEFEQADAILEQLMRQQPNTTTMIRATYFRAHIADILENYGQAFSYLHRLDQYPRLAISRHQQFKTLTLATNLYSKANAYALALDFARRALSIARQGSSAQMMCYALRSITNIYINSKEYDKAKSYASQSIEFCTDAKEPTALANSYVNLSYWYREHQDYTQQRQLLTQAITLYQQQHFKLSINFASLLLVESYILDNDFVNAGKIMTNVFSDVEQLNVLSELMLGYRLKAMLFEHSGDWPQAMVYFKKFLAAASDVNGNSSKLNQAYLQMRFDNKISQQSKVINQIEHNNIKLMIKIEGLTNILIVVCALLVLSISFYCFTFYRRSKTMTTVERSNFDELTQLYNADYGFSLAKTMLENSESSELPFGVVCINIDFMSAVNNSFSHDFGDILLQAFASKIKCLVSDDGIVIRHSGDSFIACTRSLDTEQLTDLIIKIHQCLDGIMIDRQKIIVSCSIGWTLEHGEQYSNVDQVLSLLIDHATEALEQAKFSGRNQWLRYQPAKSNEPFTELNIRRISDSF